MVTHLGKIEDHFQEAKERFYQHNVWKKIVYTNPEGPCLLTMQGASHPLLIGLEGYRIKNKFSSDGFGII